MRAGRRTEKVDRRACVWQSQKQTALFERPSGDDALTRRADISWTSRLAVWVRLGREILRVLWFPLRVLFYLPVHGHYQRRTADLLRAPAGRDHRARNEDARSRFRRVLGESPLRHVFLSCCEPSGEGHARAVVAELRGRARDVELSGFGGRALEAAGVTLLANTVDDAIMGFRKVLARLPFYMRVVGRFLDHLRDARPDVVVLLDSPGLHVILAEEAKRRGIPVLYYICPQYWGWAPWRLKRFCKAVDGAISILPFERPLFERHGVPTAFAGSPLATRVPELAPEPREPILALLPGSRLVEIERNLPPLLELFRRFQAAHPEARAIIPQLNPGHMQRIHAICKRQSETGGPIHGVELREGGVFSVLAKARAALVKSGTSTLQTALCRTPQIVFFKVSGRGEFWLSRLLTVPWIAAPNLILGRAAVPELLFSGDRTWNEVYDRLLELWPDGAPRQAQLAALDEVRRRVSGSGATAEAVRWILPDTAGAEPAAHRTSRVKT